MSVNLQEVIEAGGYDLTTVDDSIWLLAQRNEFEFLIEQAEEVIEKAQEYQDELNQEREED